MNSVENIVENPHRVNRLYELELLDTPAEEAFDRLTRLASKILDVPVSLVSLVDADRQFFKSFIGLPEPWASHRETPLSHSFCQYVVATEEPLIVEDARKHPVLKYNQAIPDLNVIGYLGMPLITTDGTPLGSFCVIDGKPRIWTAREVEIVGELALSVMTEIELRSQIKARIQTEEILTRRNQQYKRVYHLAGTTINHMRETLNRGAEKEELLVYLSNMEDELDKLGDR